MFSELHTDTTRFICEPTERLNVCHFPLLLTVAGPCVCLRISDPASSLLEQEDYLAGHRPGTRDTAPPTQHRGLNHNRLFSQKFPELSYLLVLA